YRPARDYPGVHAPRFARQGAAHHTAPVRLQFLSRNRSHVHPAATLSRVPGGLVFQWLKEQGGLAAMEVLNRRKAEKLYGYIDGSGFYRNPVQPDCRSWMNVPFVLADDKLDRTFLHEAEEARLLNLAGHRSVGGMRASIYNAVPEAAVDALIDFMKDFAQRHG